MSEQLFLSDQSQLEYCMCTNKDKFATQYNSSQRSWYKLPKPTL